jgi:hypothetical protein
MNGLPSLRALDGAQGARIWLAAEATDIALRFRSSCGAGAGGDWPGSFDGPIVRVSFAPG